MKYFKIAIFIILISSCGKSNKNTLNDQPPKDSSIVKNEEPQKCEYQNEIVNTIFVTNVGVNTFSKKEDMQIKKIKNTHDPEIIDKVVSFNNDGNYYAFYLTETDTFLTDAVIKTKTDITVKDLAIGQKQESVNTYLSISGNNRCDSLVLYDLEKYTYLTLHFKDQVLSELVLKSKVD